MNTENFEADVDDRWADLERGSSAWRRTTGNFVRAETDHYFKAYVDRGCLGRFCHDRGPPPVDKQTVIRMNRDTPYSAAVLPRRIVARSENGSADFGVLSHAG